ncbi:hypothetical protein ATETN484_0012038200 [Aspergillus terreus]|nr:hypothetical protein ATETN484_0012038200 [Aspergillus terreus]
MSRSTAAANMLPSAIAESIQKNDHAVLVVVLEDTPESMEAEIINSLQRYFEGAQFHVWRPSDFLLREIAGRVQHASSQARLYSLALLAHRSGVPGFLVVDWQTLSLIRDRKTVSTAMVMVRPALEPQGNRRPCHELHVFTCRSGMFCVDLDDDKPAEGGAAELLHALYASDVPEILADREPLHEDDFYTLELHDPDRPVFAADTAPSSQYEMSAREMKTALSMHSPLPLELVHNIVSLALDHQPITPPTTIRRSRNRLNIHLLSPATPEEFHHTQAVIKQAVRDLLQEDMQESDTRRSQRANEDDDQTQEPTAEVDVQEEDIGEIQTEDEDCGQEMRDWFYEGPTPEYDFYEDISDDEMFDREICAGHYNAYDDHDDILHKPRRAKAPSPDDITVELIPWNHNRVATRRDLASIWATYHRHITISNTINFLCEPIKDAAEVGRARFISIYETPLGYPIISFTRLEDMLDELRSVHQMKRRLQELTRPLLDDRSSYPHDMEVLMEADRSIYPRNLVDLVWTRFPIQLSRVMVFSLTNKLAGNEEAAVARLLFSSEQSNHDRHDEFLGPLHKFVPWDADKAEDGSLDDMWRILLEMRATSRHNYSDPPYLFIDHQSTVDGTVIVAGPDLHCGDRDPDQILEDVPDPKLKGMLYCRIPAQRTHGIRFDEHHRALPMDNWKIEAKRFPRPGWPGHGILREPDDYVPVVAIRST